MERANSQPRRLQDADDHVVEAEGFRRVVRDELTGLPVVVGRPGEPMVTSEMIRKELEDFP